MGIATLMIIVCHAASWCPGLPPVVRSFLLLGNLGVDLFLFLSGVGLFFSWSFLLSSSKQGECPRVKWFFHRYVRLLIPYLLISIPFYVFLGCLKDESLSTIISNITTLSYWTKHEGAWYVAMLIPLYLVTPLLIMLFSDSRKWLWFVLLTVCCLLSELIGLEPDGIFKNVQFVISRLPSFFWGICIGGGVKARKVVIIRPFVIIMEVVTLLSLAYIAYRCEIVFAVFIVPCLVFICCLLFGLMNTKFHDFMKLLGGVSLESYLLNIYLPRLFCVYSFPILRENQYFMYLATILLGVSGALLFGSINKKIVERVNRFLKI